MSALEKFTNFVLQNPAAKAVKTAVRATAEWITTPSHVRAMLELSRIVDTARSGNIDALEKHLRKLDRSHFENEPFIKTLVAAAAEHGQKEVVQMLLDKGASAEGEYNGLVHAERALQAGHASIVETLHTHTVNKGLQPSAKLSVAFAKAQLVLEKSRENPEITPNKATPPGKDHPRNK